jgi:hypothetical protein
LFFCGFGLIECHDIVESFELALQALGAVFDRVALALPVRNEVSVWDLVANDVLVGDEQVVAAVTTRPSMPTRRLTSSCIRCSSWFASSTTRSLRGAADVSYPTLNPARSGRPEYSGHEM